MNIPPELRDRVKITDHGVMDQVDPESGDTVRSYVMTYTVVGDDSIEYGLTIASSQWLIEMPQEVYDRAVDLGVYGVLDRARLLP